MSHPNPLDYTPRDPEMEEIVGWFMIGFRSDPDHEYPFVVRKDNTILPEYHLTKDIEPSDRTMFYRYLADPELHHVRYTQSRYAGDTTGRDIKHNPWKSPLPA